MSQDSFYPILSKNRPTPEYAYSISTPKPTVAAWSAVQSKRKSALYRLWTGMQFTGVTTKMFLKLFTKVLGIVDSHHDGDFRDIIPIFF